MIRQAKIEDKEAIAKIIVDGWKTAYKGMISDEFLNNLSYERKTKGMEKFLEEQNENNKIYVYEEENKMLGVIKYGLPEEKNTKYTSELFILYIKPEEKYRGIGTQLFNFAINDLKSMGHKNMILYCLKDNLSSRKFYEKVGGKNIKERVFEVNNVVVTEVGYEYNF